MPALTLVRPQAIPVEPEPATAAYVFSMRAAHQLICRTLRAECMNAKQAYDAAEATIAASAHAQALTMSPVALIELLTAALVRVHVPTELAEAKAVTRVSHCIFAQP